MRFPNYEVVQNETNDQQIVIRDIGPHSEFPTVTNAAELVVEHLAKYGLLSNNRRLFYYDSTGRRDELLHENGLFIGFQFGGVTPVTTA